MAALTTTASPRSSSEGRRVLRADALLHRDALQPDAVLQRDVALLDRLEAVSDVQRHARHRREEREPAEPLFPQRPSRTPRGSGGRDRGASSCRSGRTSRGPVRGLRHRVEKARVVVSVAASRVEAVAPAPPAAADGLARLPRGGRTCRRRAASGRRARRTGPALADWQLVVDALVVATPPDRFIRASIAGRVVGRRDPERGYGLVSSRIPLGHILLIQEQMNTPIESKKQERRTTTRRAPSSPCSRCATTRPTSSRARCAGRCATLAASREQLYAEPKRLEAGLATSGRN